MKILFADLDNTLIYSYKHDIGNRKRNVELYQGREISFITEKTYGLLQQVKDKMLIVPTTTRTVEQYERIDFGIGAFSYALVCNGGLLLEHGKSDDAWYQESLKLVRPGVPEVLKAMELLKADARRTFELRFIKDLFLFTKCSEPELVIEDLKGKLDTSKVDVFHNGEKVYVVPAALNKGNALRRLKERIEGGGGRKDEPVFCIAAGDSGFDVPMLRAADLGLAPEGFLGEFGSMGHVKELAGEGIFSELLLMECLKVWRNV